MYYLENMLGEVTFKVKGRSTTRSTMKYEYEGLVDALVTGKSVTFDHQLSFKRVSKTVGTGVVVKEDLIKTYNIRQTKRDWVHVDGGLSTKPIVVKLKETITDTVKQLKRDPALAMQIMKESEMPQRTDETQLPRNMRQHLVGRGRKIVFKMPLYNYQVDFFKL